RLTLLDRLIFVWLYRCRPAVLNAVTIVRPETVVRWHRDGFRLFWRWKSRARGGRPRISSELRRLLREMSVANPLWGAPRIHGGSQHGWSDPIGNICGHGISHLLAVRAAKRDSAISPRRTW